jgi:replication fork protection complex subunit Tof1/Swi1
VEQNEDKAQLERLAKLTILERALISYKAAILRARSGETHGSEHDVLQTVMLHILLPSLSKPRPLRTERDTGTISMCLHLFRNLLAIKDPLASSLSSNETIAASRLQSDLVVALDKAHILDTLLMLASSSETRELEPWNAVTAECIYQIFSGTKAVLLVPSADQTPAAPEPQVSGAAPAAVQRKVSQPPAAPRCDAAHIALQPRPASASALASSLNAEASQRRAALMQNGPTRHSRFGTALTFTGTDGRRRVSRTQASLRKTSEQLTEEAAAKQKRRPSRRKAVREKGAARLKTDWTKEARAVLTRWAAEFLRVGFERE